MTAVHRTRGSLLVITLWLVTLLSVFAIAVARHLSLELRLTKYQLARERAKALARSGVSLAMQQLAADAADAEEPYDWLGDDWALPQEAVQTADGVIQVRAIADEERKLDLNAATGNSNSGRDGAAKGSSVRGSQLATCMASR